MWGVSLHCDSQATIGTKTICIIARGDIRIRHGVAKQLLKNGVISLEFVRSERNLAVPLMKGLTKRVTYIL